MRIRSRHATVIISLCCVPFALIAERTGNRNIIFLTAILIILISFSIDKLYEIFFYNSNSTCAFYAGKIALEYGYNPKAQDGFIWNPNDYKVSDLYRMYPNRRENVPVKGSCGFMFYTNKNKTYSRHFEFYDFRSGGDTFFYYKFFLHPWDSARDCTEKMEMSISEIGDKKVFVALEFI